MVQQSNNDIRQKRAAFLEVSKQLADKRTLTKKQTESIGLLAKKYRVTTDEPLSEKVMPLLDRRVDSIPASMALAQAANELGWGTARFAVKGNNYFGLWCWSSNFDLVPNKREKGASHEVSRFKTPVDSVKNYMLTLSSHQA